MEAIEKLEQKREKSEEENSIEHEEILELREPIEKILTALKDSIEKGEYQLVIGDDKSGRIPTFILHKVIGALYEKHDHPRPRTRFFAGIHVPDKNLEQQRIEQIRRHVSEYIIKYGKPKRVLVVTESIKRGTRLFSLTAALRKLELPCDIATIGLEFPDRKEDLEKKLKANIVYGMVGTPSIYNAKYLSGVEKHYANYKEKYELLHTKPAQEMKEEKQEARKDATILADELTEWYEKNVRPREE